MDVLSLVNCRLYFFHFEKSLCYYCLVYVASEKLKDKNCHHVNHRKGQRLSGKSLYSVVTEVAERFTFEFGMND